MSEKDNVLQPADIGEIKKNITEDHPAASEVETKARAFVEEVIQASAAGDEARRRAQAQAEAYAQKPLERAVKSTSLISAPIKELQDKSEDGGEVAHALIQLRDLVTKLDPKGINQVSGWRKALSVIPGLGNPLKKYFQRFESTQAVITEILASLSRGREELKRDNISLIEDQKILREAVHELQATFDIGEAIHRELNHRLDTEVPEDDPKHRFLKEEILFPLRQRLLDIQQQLAVSQQGVIASEILIRNNKELIRGVNRASTVTISALEVAVTVALALANQRIVLDKVQTVNQTTSDLIAGTSRQLKEQGAMIQAQASQATLDMDSLKGAFETLLEALDDISNFRLKALDQMAENIDEMKQLTERGHQRMDELENKH